MDATWILAHIALATPLLIEALNLPEKCIYSDFDNIVVQFKEKKITLEEMLCSEQFKYKKQKFCMSDILTTRHILSVMRIFSILPTLLIALIVFLPLGKILFSTEIDIDWIVSILWYILYFVEIVAIVLRIKSDIGICLIKLHPDYINNSISSILYFHYFKK